MLPLNPFLDAIQPRPNRTASLARYFPQVNADLDVGDYSVEAGT